MDFNKLNFISHQFFTKSIVLKIDEVKSGNINKTYIIEHLHNRRKSKFILQRLSNIFESHEIVNLNHKLVTEHLNKKLDDNYFGPQFNRWQVPSLIKCNSNNLFIFFFESNFWRAMSYINNSSSFDCLKDKKMAYEVGVGLSKFHLMCSDLDCSKIINTIKNFHNTNFYIDKFLMNLKSFNFEQLDITIKKRLDTLTSGLSFHVKYIQFFLEKFKNHSIKDKIIHGDPKLSNFLFDRYHGFVTSLIDLDTVSSGYILTDLADCIRSICNLSGENPEDLVQVHFDINSCQSFLEGYFSLSEKNKFDAFNLLPEFIYVIIFELAIRFLTDFLQSNIYFKTNYYTHNLFRAEVQFHLLCSFLSQSTELSSSLDQLGIPSTSSIISNERSFI